MKKSIRFQIVSVFLAFVFISVLFMVLLNYGFLEKVYLKEKENTLKLVRTKKVRVMTLVSYYNLVLMQSLLRLRN